MTKGELLEEAERMILALDGDPMLSISRDHLKGWMVLFHQHIISGNKPPSVKKKIEKVNVTDDLRNWDGIEMSDVLSGKYEIISSVADNNSLYLIYSYDYDETLTEIAEDE